MTLLGRRSRRALAALLVGSASLLAAACGGSDSGSSDEGPVSLTVFQSLNAIGARTAEAEGIFAAEGLDVEITTGSNAAAALPQMIGGSVDIALLDMVTALTAGKQGVPIAMIAPGGVTKEPVENRGFINLIVKDSSPVRSFADLEGRSVGIIQINSQPWMDTRAVVDEAGGDSSKVGFVEVPNLLTALDQGQVDAVVVPDPIGVTALADPTNRLLGGVATADQIGDPEYAFVTTKQYAAQNPETIAKFQAAILAANEAANNSPERSLEIAKGYLEVPAEILDQATMPMLGTEPMTAEAIQASTSRMARYGLITDEQAAELPTTILYSSN